jgi:hypothetical protein
MGSSRREFFAVVWALILGAWRAARPSPNPIIPGWIDKGHWDYPAHAAELGMGDYLPSVFHVPFGVRPPFEVSPWPPLEPFRSELNAAAKLWRIEGFDD